MTHPIDTASAAQLIKSWYFLASADGPKDEPELVYQMRVDIEERLCDYQPPTLEEAIEQLQFAVDASVTGMLFGEGDKRGRDLLLSTIKGLKQISGAQRQRDS